MHYSNCISHYLFSTPMHPQFLPLYPSKYAFPAAPFPSIQTVSRPQATMPLPTLRPGLQLQQQPPICPMTPPPASPCSSTHKECPADESPQTPYGDILLAQEAAKDQRLHATAEKLWRDSQEFSCAEDNETTPWLQHTRWPKTFRDRPLDVIAGSTRQPAQGPNRNKEDYLLGIWQGVPL